MFASPFASLLHSFRNFRRTSAGRSRSSRFSPRLELLEERTVPAFQLRLEQAGFADLLITDNGPGDASDVVGSIQFVGSYGTFDINVTTGNSKPLRPTSPTMAHLDLATLNLSTTSGGTLIITLADTDFTTPSAVANPLTLTSEIGGTLTGSAGSSVTFQGWANPRNLSPLPGGPPTLIPPGSVTPGPHGPFGPGAFDSAATTTFNREGGPYALFLQGTIALAGPGRVGFNADLVITGQPVPSAAVGDFVWLDRNVNGIQDAGEPGVPNVTVQLLQNNAVVATTTTDANGLYLFGNLTPGDYQVMFVPPAGQVFTLPDQGANDALDSDANPATGKTVVFTLAPGQIDLTWDAGLKPIDLSLTKTVNNPAPAVGSNVVFTITVANAAGFSTATGVTVSDVLPAGLAFVSATASQGSYNSTTGIWTVGTVNAGAGATLTITATVTTGGTKVNLAQVQTADQPDIDSTPGNRPAPPPVEDDEDVASLTPPGELGDFVWRDLNANGIQDAGEPGIPDVQVKLLDATGTVLRTTTTDSNGLYRFTNLSPGNYRIMFTRPVDLVFTAADQGSDDALDSDADTDGMTALIALASGEVDRTWDAGLVAPRRAPGALGDFVWEDLDFDGIQDADEPGIPNVTVQLFTTANVLVATTVTDGNGLYLFTNVQPGDYYLVFTPPTGYVVTAPNQGGNDAVDSDINVVTGRTADINLTADEIDLTWDAGLYRVGSLSGFVYVDANNNGERETGEAPIPSTVIMLLGTDDLGNAVNRTTTTDAFGAYRFDNLRAGTYQVIEKQPTGFLDGKDKVGSLGGILGNDMLSAIPVGPGDNGINYNFGELLPATLSGFVRQRNICIPVGRGGAPRPIRGVLVTLTGVDDLGNSVAITGVSARSGFFVFSGLRPGVYQIIETAPRMYRLGPAIPGTTGGNPGLGTLSNIVLQSGVTSTNNILEVLICPSKEFLMATSRRRRR